MTDIENRILEALRENARISTEKLARMAGVTEEEAAKTVKSLEDEGTIVKYTAVINADKETDDKVEALIEVKVTPHKGSGFDAIAEDLSDLPEVRNLYLMSGAYDLAVIVEGKSLRDVSRFVSEKISKYDDVLSTATHFILKKYKVEGARTSKLSPTQRLSVQP
ncbi:MAG: Lrp/AsnC family transcriptional regulator [Clostridia bacterium]|nr:Lrp/AsnC family transcriptional regulator [Clostridia bacterium]